MRWHHRAAGPIFDPRSYTDHRRTRSDNYAPGCRLRGSGGHRRDCRQYGHSGSDANHSMRTIRVVPLWLTSYRRSRLMS
jgi:hypothetical protein